MNVSIENVQKSGTSEITVKRTVEEKDESTFYIGIPDEENICLNDKTANIIRIRFERIPCISIKCTSGTSQ
jgi:hypothetical protein